ncbi:MAG: ferredoxin [Armatimonadetes bacterium CG_4_10_14_3_um_filter_66_18]|nr:ferredoxin [Armatimonadota bacterium]OIP07318.1 MAG: ferredoxin [Armatimonadetes bacterium CG2_30_66_41]PIU95414.1 MAG: ferredoxin [Armatimonadetes bacterium CG06_land_8_20_14_3_00_66_21]PIX43563.1 MAG: ferredoxin [Armatimonadetes bacterium CG_4_8_14_3_um_filter_66_20]PIY50389.1 MAG: ferredoxin [Armatimonadetes bacterium CG_4_10_14_3_um_filter_66_18]PIZ36601.1 MAG: ferredoxin [Armatimonadetes bacterium CG_4_10_14_0_8_um_filter_66_14]PJB75121.1 MAG: ferredoxin [Armatimonadetes bacterium CG_
MAKPTDATNRREFLGASLRGACLLGVGGLTGLTVARGKADDLVWQLDPQKCIQCDNCATHCVLEESAVKCVNSYEMCGYCDLCTGYFEPEPNALDTGAENQLCPTGAIIRTFVEDPYFSYDIDEPLCVGCGKCVKGCAQFGNGSLYLQVRHDRCLNCNECSIARACPTQAFRRVPASKAYLLKGREAQGA